MKNFIFKEGKVELINEKIVNLVKKNQRLIFFYNEVQFFGNLEIENSFLITHNNKIEKLKKNCLNWINLIKKRKDRFYNLNFEVTPKPSILFLIEGFLNIEKSLKHSAEICNKFLSTEILSNENFNNVNIISLDFINSNVINAILMRNYINKIKNN